MKPLDRILETAKAAPRHIVLAEGEDPRVVEMYGKINTQASLWMLVSGFAALFARARLRFLLRLPG